MTAAHTLAVVETTLVKKVRLRMLSDTEDYHYTPEHCPGPLIAELSTSAIMRLPRNQVMLPSAIYCGRKTRRKLCIGFTYRRQRKAIASKNTHTTNSVLQCDRLYRPYLLCKCTPSLVPFHTHEHSQRQHVQGTH